jgi:hypothetical protein
MLIALQAPVDAPAIPWWVLYLALIGITWATWKLTRLRWWGGCVGAGCGWMILLVAGILALPSSQVGLILLLTLAPVAAWITALVRRGGANVPAPVLAALPARAAAALRGQPSARSVLRSKMMEFRYAAGMPAGPRFLARVRYLAGLQGLQPRNVDLFAAGGQLWVAPLTEDAPPQAIGLQDLLRADVAPEADGTPALRLSWSPPAGEYTRDLVLAADAQLAASEASSQLTAIAGLVTSLMEEDAETRRNPQPQKAAATARICSVCGSTLPAQAAACPSCGAPAARP